MFLRDFALGLALGAQAFSQKCAGLQVVLALLPRPVETTAAESVSDPSPHRSTAFSKNGRNRAGLPYGARPMILYSSELKSKPRWRVTREYRFQSSDSPRFAGPAQFAAAASVDGSAVRLAHRIHDDHRHSSHPEVRYALAAWAR